MITTQGKSVIFRYLAGYIPRIAESIAIGVSDKPASVNDTVLGFETNRVLINITSADMVNNKIIFKGIIPQEFVGKIHEVGLWYGSPAQSAGASSIIVDFDSTAEEWDTGTWDTTLARIGSDALQLTGGQSSTLADIALDLSGYSDSDFLSLAYSADATIDNVTVQFKTDDLNYYSYTFAAATGYEVKSFGKMSTTATGTPDWENITKITVSATGTGNIVFDGIRAEDNDTISNDYALVARTVLSTPKSKTDDSEMDVEYALEINI
ncbi:minor tail protein [Streptomyces phage Yaboi]|uniref:Minor tail protein n=3 Tax=Streptomyces virus Yaboi TaxID=2846408 RepID=A0A385UGL8_9CAUD|nr:tail protein [Streptomyces phage Yaboi]QAY08726.1 minor tail protein [Streptomyces phage Genie2]QAY12716.1 minor tail protein [Streptomyces phage BoomerJR]UVD39912.1 minor tail protein [Streptomyces phage Stanimal]WNM73653.1 minor tail protein [Streptomyces phage Sollertia]AYB70902.1 minor tail protein [Streptomyces phage Yaboi]